MAFFYYVYIIGPNAIQCFNKTPKHAHLAEYVLSLPAQWLAKASNVCEHCLC